MRRLPMIFSALFVAMASGASLSEEAQARCGLWLAASGLGKLLPEHVLDGGWGCMSGLADSVTQAQRVPEGEKSDSENFDLGRCRESQFSSTRGGRCSFHIVRVIRSDLAFCSGTVVAPGVVLTAAHCLPALQVEYGGNTESPDLIVPVLGVARPEDRKVDIALLRVATPGDALPVPWRLPGEDSPPEPQRSLSVIGYGYQNVGQTTVPKNRSGAYLEIEPDWGCNTGNHRELGCRPGTELFAYGVNQDDIPNTGDSCLGDSGAPILEYVVPPGAEKLSAEFSFWQIVGVVSRATRDADTECGQGTIATRIDTQAQWMIDTIHRLYTRYPISY